MQKFYALLSVTTLLTPLSLLAQGDDCASAVAVTPGGHIADGPSTGAGASQADAANADWYAFTPVGDGYLTVLSCGSPTDTRVFVHAGACGALTVLGSDDDGCPEGYPPGNSLLANIPVAPGNTYYIEWDDRWSTDGFDWQLLFHGCPIIMPTLASEPFSMTVAWTVLAPGAGYTIEYGPAGFTPGTGTEVSGTQADGMDPVLIEGLAPGTAYDVYVTSDCGGGNVAPFNGPWHVSTGISGNDDCGGALPIVCGDALNGSTVGALDDAVADCGTTVTAPGIWYSFSGVNSTVILSTCADHGYDTKINVYSGSCDSLECAGGNDDGPNGCYPGSEVIFTADGALTYYVLVQGYNGATGSFTLDMSCPTCAPPQGIFAATADTTALIYWTSVHPGDAFSLEYGPDGFTPGTGTVITGIIGTDGPPVTLPGLSGSTDYDVYVTEDCGGGDPSPVTGPFSFTTLDHALAANAFCSGAIPIICGDSLAGNTTDGIFTPGPTCGSANITAPSVWYSMIGDGSDMTLSTCGQASFDSKISVFTGTCIEPVCVGGNDDGNGCGGNTSLITFYAEPGVEYLIMVHGYNDAAGAFGLSAFCDEPCEPQVINDECATAIELQPQPVGACVPVESTNMCAYPSAWPNPGCDPFAPITDVWFSLPTGPSADHTITITAGSSGALNAAVYSACDPNALVNCYVPLDGPIALTGLDTGATYFIRVWNGGGNDAGTFTICDEAPLIMGIVDANVHNGLRAWPSPVTDQLNVEGLPADAREVRLYDAQGRSIRVLATPAGGKAMIDMSDTAPGVYVLRTDGAVPCSISVMKR